MWRAKIAGRAEQGQKLTGQGLHCAAAMSLPHLLGQGDEEAVVGAHDCVDLRGIAAQSLHCLLMLICPSQRVPARALAAETCRRKIPSCWAGAHLLDVGPEALALHDMAVGQQLAGVERDPAAQRAQRSSGGRRRQVGGGGGSRRG